MDTMGISVGCMCLMDDPQDIFDFTQDASRNFQKDYRWLDRPLLCGMESGELPSPQPPTTTHHHPPPTAIQGLYGYHGNLHGMHVSHGRPSRDFQTYSRCAKRLSRDYRWLDRPLLCGMERRAPMATTTHHQPPPPNTTQHHHPPPPKGYMDTMEISMGYMYLMDDPQEIFDFTHDVSRDYQETIGG